MHTKRLVKAGKELEIGTKVLVMVHGRGGSAEDILGLAPHLKANGFCLLAPQATNNTWYPYSFLAPPTENEPWLSSALDVLSEVVSDIEKAGIHSNDVFLLGFSQGACLTLEFAARNARRYGAVVAFTGGLIGDRIYPENYKGDFNDTPIFIGSSDPDPHVPLERVNDSAAFLEKMNARVIKKVYKNMGHTINQEEIQLVNEKIFGK
jgi:phospholipase/carboxylesterase